MVDLAGLRSIRLEDNDVVQVRSILSTHAEIQDQHIGMSLELIGRLKRDDPDDGADMIAELEDQVRDLEADSDNLKRIATMFQ